MARSPLPLKSAANASGLCKGWPRGYASFAAASLSIIDPPQITQGACRTFSNWKWEPAEPPHMVSRSLAKTQPSASAVVGAYCSRADRNLDADRSVSTSLQVNSEAGHSSFDIRRTTRTVQVRPSSDRMVRRKLRGVQLFMITLNGTLGAGLYWRGGHALQVGGVLSLVLSFLLVGFLAWAVMQCIAEMLCLWPIPGAISVYVRTFVDDELGIAVGVAYWFTYSISFSALLAIVATQVSFWTNGNETYNDAIIYVLTPVVLVTINSIEIGTFGWIEVAFGTIKLVFLAFVIAMLSFIMARASALEASGTEPGRSVFRRPSAKVSGRCESQPDAAELVGRRVRFSAIYFPPLAAGAYTISSMLASLLISQSHCSLPHLSWADPVECRGGDRVMHTSSMFVIIADEAGIPGLSHVFNGIIVFTALTCANTNLYVASRCLFGLTTRLEGGSRQPLHVPSRVRILPSSLPCKFPMGGSTNMNCANSIDEHQKVLEQQQIPRVNRQGDDYPYHSHGQPYLACAAFVGCLFILFISNSSSLWNGFEAEAFLSSFLIVSVASLAAATRLKSRLLITSKVLVFLFLWIILKIFRGGKWSLVNLSSPERFTKKMRELHDICFEATIVD
ncbi:hypothetical protein S40288_03369 [Stachybotrys chartarum IBT 40288]|nr:hypothetical protein S40288_03369 [Stachybotrys chartarum IBT 40288]